MKSSIVSFIRYQNSALILVMKKNNFGQFLLARIKYLLNKGIVLALVILNRPLACPLCWGSAAPVSQKSGVQIVHRSQFF